jgi:hypothetical protein
MDEEPYRQVLEEHRRPGRRPVLAAIALLLLAIVLGLIYGSTIPQGLRPWMVELLYPPLE